MDCFCFWFVFKHRRTAWPIYFILLIYILDSYIAMRSFKKIFEMDIAVSFIIFFTSKISNFLENKIFWVLKPEFSCCHPFLQIVFGGVKYEEGDGYNQGYGLLLGYDPRRGNRCVARSSISEQQDVMKAFYLTFDGRKTADQITNVHMISFYSQCVCTCTHQDDKLSYVFIQVFFNGGKRRRRLMSDQKRKF